VDNKRGSKIVQRDEMMEMCCKVCERSDALLIISEPPYRVCEKCQNSGGGRK